YPHNSERNQNILVSQWEIAIRSPSLIQCLTNDSLASSEIFWSMTRPSHTICTTTLQFAMNVLKSVPFNLFALAWARQLSCAVAAVGRNARNMMASANRLMAFRWFSIQPEQHVVSPPSQLERQ